MPWSRSSTGHPNTRKAVALRRRWQTDGPDNRLFEACFRLQREACEASGRFIPLLVENVAGAEEWVGPARWKYGAQYLWGDVPALMPFGEQRKGAGGSWFGEYAKRGDPRDGRTGPRKQRTAEISKIPPALSGYIGRVYYPHVEALA
jgi:hypothetical protein